MAYRKLDVDGTPFEYTVGKQYVKIRGIGEVAKSIIGYVVDDYTVRVSPQHVVDFIRSQKGHRPNW